MKNVFKLLFIALAVIIVCPTFAQTEGDFNVDLTEDGTGVVIKGYTGKQAAITIPAKIQGYPVKVIGNAAFSLGGIVDLLVGQTMVGSGTGTRLTSVTIPVGVVSIGREAFAKQSTLTSVSIPASVTSMVAPGCQSPIFRSVLVDADTLPIAQGTPCSLLPVPVYAGAGGWGLGERAMSNEQ